MCSVEVGHIMSEVNSSVEGVASLLNRSSFSAMIGGIAAIA